MEWIEIFVETSQIGLELVSGLLYQCGLTGLMIEDSSDFEEFLQNPNREWDYIEDELVEQKQKQLTGITFFIRDLGTLKVVVKNIKEEDWANNWKKYFKPFAIGDKIIIKPSWEELEQTTEKIVLKIDPAHIFGTGTHETTQLCIEFIEQFVKKEDTIFDIGCGSGILSIASLLLGASYADAIDIDANAVDVAYENAKRNDIDKKRYHVVSGNILDDEILQKTYSDKKYDVVEANIVADVIIALSKQVPDYIKDKGIFICSGIIKQREEDVKQALQKNHFTILDIKYKKDWVAIISRYDG